MRSRTLFVGLALTMALSLLLPMAAVAEEHGTEPPDETGEEPDGEEPEPEEEAPEPERVDLLDVLVDVDWSRYAETGVRFQTMGAEGGSDDEAAAREALYSAASTGHDTFTAQQADTGPGDQWYDTCGDAQGSRLDLRSTHLVRSGDQQGFLGYTCHPWATSDLGDGAIVWALHTPEYSLDQEEGHEGFPTFLVAAFRHQGELVSAVIRTPSADRGTWYLTWRADAERLDDFALDVVVPAKAFGESPEFRFEWALVEDRPAAGVLRTDIFPDPPLPYSALALYPQRCEGPNYVGQVAATFPDDGASDDGWFREQINLPPQRDSGAIRVAVIGDGVDARDGMRVTDSWDAVYDENRQRIGSARTDRGGQATAVAGLLATPPGDHLVEGVAPRVRVVPIRVTSSDGCITPGSLVAALDYAVRVGADVIALPIAGPALSPPETDEVAAAVDRALGQDVVLVAAAGNSQDVAYPAAYPGIISVGATTSTGDVARYSLRHRTVDLVAPGGSGGGTPSSDVMAHWELGRVRPQWGTGVSIGFVAGAAALYRAAYPEASNGHVRVALEQSARDEGPPGHDPGFGYGVLDVAALLATPPGTLAATGELERIGGHHPDETAIAISEHRFPDGGAQRVVLARIDDFADALAGAALTSGGPLLFSSHQVLSEATRTELRRVLPSGGTVFLLGGEEAISPAVAHDLDQMGYAVHRLRGPTRVETALAVGEQVRALHPSATVLLARAHGSGADETAAWADAITGGAWAAHARVPLLFTETDRLHPAVAASLEGWGIARTVLLGGTAALSTSVEASVPGPDRRAGPDRAATATRIAGLWPDPGGFVVANGYLASGWAFGLPAAGLAADRGAPLLLTASTSVPPATTAHLAGHCGGQPVVTLIGSANVIDGGAERTLAQAASC